MAPRVPYTSTMEQKVCAHMASRKAFEQASTGELGRAGRLLFFLLRNEAQAMVELALTLPIMLLIVTGICTFGIAMTNYLILTDATNAGARQLAILRGQASDPCSTVVTTVKAAAPLLAASGLTFTFTINGTNYTGTNTVSCTAGATGLITRKTRPPH